MDEEPTVSQLIEQAGFRRIDVARHLGVHKSMVTRWCQGKVPPERCVALGDLIKVEPHTLRPDIFPAPAPANQGGA